MSEESNYDEEQEAHTNLVIREIDMNTVMDHDTA
jgi:hypothetical protein